jgi:hypothetical protein
MPSTFAWFGSLLSRATLEPVLMFPLQPHREIAELGELGQALRFLLQRREIARRISWHPPIRAGGLANPAVIARLDRATQYAVASRLYL